MSRVIVLVIYTCTFCPKYISVLPRNIFRSCPEIYFGPRQFFTPPKNRTYPSPTPIELQSFYQFELPQCCHHLGNSAFRYPELFGKPLIRSKAPFPIIKCVNLCQHHFCQRTYFFGKPNRCFYPNAFEGALWLNF